METANLCNTVRAARIVVVWGLVSEYLQPRRAEVDPDPLDPCGVMQGTGGNQADEVLVLC